MTTDWRGVHALVEDVLGLAIAPQRSAHLQQAIRAAAARDGDADPGEWLRRLMDARTPALVERALAPHLTIGETYFLRDRPALDALAGHALPELIATRRARGERRLRIWSAGCASGEEPYTLAIVLSRLLPDLAEWDVCITGTDVNPAVLARADAGVYGPWSLRGVGPGVLAQYFSTRADGRYEIAGPIRRMVRFASHNLVCGQLPAGFIGAVDLVVCRNVLMYFSARQRARALDAIALAMHAHAWLAVGAAEHGPQLARHWHAVKSGSTFIYRRQPQPAPVPLPRIVSRGGLAAATPPLAAKPDDGEPLVAQARAAADAGDLVRALQLCDRRIRSCKLDARSHRLRGMILLEQGLLEPARAALQRAVFLDPAFVLAHCALADIARRTGDMDEARRRARHANHLLTDLPDAAPVPDGDGLATGHLRSDLATLLAAPGEAPR